MPITFDADVPISPIEKIKNKYPLKLRMIFLSPGWGVQEAMSSAIPPSVAIQGHHMAVDSDMRQADHAGRRGNTA